MLAEGVDPARLRSSHDDAPRGARTTLGTAGYAGIALLLIVAANGWATAYVSSERYIYAWDWASYWLMFQDLAALIRSDPLAALAAIGPSVASTESNVLPVLPLMPFALLFGGGRLSYILAIVNVAVLPGAAMLALVVDRTMARPSWGRLLTCTAGLLCLHVLWAPALRGLPDGVGMVLVAAILLLYVGDAPDRHRPIRLVGIGLLMCLLILSRRYYLFWAVGFFPAALFACMADGRRNRERIVATVRNLAIIGTACASFLLILAAPLVGHVATTDYTAAYAAYRAELAGGGVTDQVVGHFGIALLLLCAGGLACLVVRRDTRSLGLLVAVQTLIAFVLFTRVQSLLGVHHYHLLVPAAGIGIAGAIAATWNARWRRRWRAIGMAAIIAVVALSSVVVFAPSRPIASALLPQARYAPLVRSDLAALRHLLARLAALKPHQVYVAASSQMLNGNVLAMACRDSQPDLYAHIATSQEIDTRDGFPTGVLDADYVVLATPTQYQVMPADQRVVGLVARDMREGRGIGASFRRLPGTITLSQGVVVAIYRRTAPIGDDAVRALSDALVRQYPHMRRFFTPPLPRAAATPSQGYATER